VEEVRAGDPGVVVKVELLKLGAEVGDFVGRELGAGEKGGVGLGHTQGLNAALGSDDVLEGEVGLLLNDVSGGSARSYECGQIPDGSLCRSLRHHIGFAAAM
jgi:hypothetical protein